jgi:hypothetical protein
LTEPVKTFLFVSCAVVLAALFVLLALSPPDVPISAEPEIAIANRSKSPGPPVSVPNSLIPTSLHAAKPDGSGSSK